ncbi:hypothetical protein D3C79_545870 [compost metagenome]
MTLKSMSKRSTVSVSIEWPKRYTVWANSATIEASRSTSYTWVGAKNRSTRGCTVRANSSNTRCWYCISVPNLAAWNSRSPFHTRAPISAGVTGKALTGLSSHSLRKARSPESSTVSMVCATSRLCSEWKIACTAVRPMFSLTRPSPAM